MNGRFSKIIQALLNDHNEIQVNFFEASNHCTDGTDLEFSLWLEMEKMYTITVPRSK